ncbi:MAG: hypothetical protein JSW17_04265 [Candidatus Omnitrophota bacterium]|nr:MAG: hypothetical protein JSW17_04265 [Candidatus Omnitrophota bacterium]
MRKIASVIITTCIFAVNFVQNALPGPRNISTHPARGRQINRRYRHRGIKRNVAKPVPANQALDYGKIQTQNLDHTYGKVHRGTTMPKLENQAMDDGEHGDRIQPDSRMWKLERFDRTYGKIHGSSAMPKLENVTMPKLEHIMPKLESISNQHKGEDLNR